MTSDFYAIKRMTTSSRQQRHEQAPQPKFGCKTAREIIKLRDCLQLTMPRNFSKSNNRGSSLTLLYTLIKKEHKKVLLACQQEVSVALKITFVFYINRLSAELV